MEEHMIKIAFVCKELEPLLDSDQWLARATANDGTLLPFFKSTDYTANSGFLQRNLPSTKSIKDLGA